MELMLRIETEKTKQEVEKTKRIQWPAKVRIEDEIVSDLDNSAGEGVDNVAVDFEQNRKTCLSEPVVFWVKFGAGSISA
jgi:hypothetical protein